MSPEEEREVAAWHEAGHAVVAFGLGWHVSGVYNFDVSIEPPNEADKNTVDNSRRSDKYFSDRIAICYGGEFGQLLKPAPVLGPELACDRRLIDEYSKILSGRGYAVELTEIRVKAQEIVERYKPVVKALADAVIEGIEEGICVEDIYENFNPHYIIHNALAKMTSTPLINSLQ